MKVSMWWFGRRLLENIVFIDKWPKSEPDYMMCDKFKHTWYFRRNGVHTQGCLDRFMPWPTGSDSERGSCRRWLVTIRKLESSCQRLETFLEKHRILVRSQLTHALVIVNKEIECCLMWFEVYPHNSINTYCHFINAFLHNLIMWSGSKTKSQIIWYSNYYH